MKERTPEQLKGQIRSFAGKRNLQSQEVLQMFLLERVLDRLSKSKHKDNFILKGGLLISSMIGIAERTTMDIGNSNSVVWRLYFYFQGEKYRCTGRNFFNWFPAVL